MSIIKSVNKSNEGKILKAIGYNNRRINDRVESFRADNSFSKSVSRKDLLKQALELYNSSFTFSNVIVRDSNQLNRNDGLRVIKEIFASIGNKSVVTQYIQREPLSGIKTVLAEATYELPPANQFNAWWNNNSQLIKLRFLNESPDMMYWDATEGSLYIYPEQTKITTNRIMQTFREGITNCMLTPIRDWCIKTATEAKSKPTKYRYIKMVKTVDELLVTYKDGVPEDKLTDICDALQIDIDITAPFGEKALLQAKSKKKALKKFKFVNTRIDHIEMNEVVSGENVITVQSIEEINMIVSKLDEMNIHYHYKKNLQGNKREVSTLTATYTVRDDYVETAKEFVKKYNIYEYKLDDRQDPEVSEFVRNGVHYNETVDFQPSVVKKNSKLTHVTDTFKHIDMTKAYTQSMKCKFYEGFLGKITDFRATDKIVGVGLYLITDIQFADNKFKAYNDVMYMYQNENIYTSAELRMLTDYGVTYTIVAGCWGVKSFDMEFTDKMITEKTTMLKGKQVKRVPYYSKWTGSCNMKNTTSSLWMKGTNEMVSIIQSNSSGTARYYGNGEIQVQYTNHYATHYSHITAFITAYMRINVIEQLMIMDINQVVRVCCDGIYYTGTTEQTALFLPKTDVKLGNDESASYCAGLNLYSYNEFPKERDHYNTELHLGEGGSGKTHYNLTDKGLVRSIYIAPSWKLATNKKEELGIKVAVWAGAITDDPEKIRMIRESNVLIWDEVSMMSNGAKEYILKTYGDMKNIFCGDIGYQLPCIEEGAIQFKPEGFNYTQTHTADWRCKCPLLKSIKVELRKMMDEKKTKQEINAWCMQKFLDIGRIINIKTLLETYHINDMIISGTKSRVSYYSQQLTGKWGELEKYYVLGCNRLYSKGDVIINETKPDILCRVQHAFTAHSIQGETAKHKLFIEGDKMFEVQMFYTAISRAQTLEQINIILPTKDENNVILKYEKELRNEAIAILETKLAKKNEATKKAKKTNDEGCTGEEGPEITDRYEYSENCKKACIAHIGQEAFDKEILVADAIAILKTKLAKN